MPSPFHREQSQGGATQGRWVHRTRANSIHDHPRWRWFAFLVVCLFPIETAGSAGEEVSFLELTPVEYYAPYLKISDIGGKNSKENREQIRAELEDFKNRIAKPWRVTREPWALDANCPQGATLTVIHNLVENGALAFEFTSSGSGEFSFELVSPKGPSLGAIRISLEETDLGILDAWSPENESSQKHCFAKSINLSSGIHRIKVTQESATDAPISPAVFPPPPLGNSPIISHIEKRHNFVRKCVYSPLGDRSRWDRDQLGSRTLSQVRPHDLEWNVFLCRGKNRNRHSLFC